MSQYHLRWGAYYNPINIGIDYVVTFIGEEKKRVRTLSFHDRHIFNIFFLLLKTRYSMQESTNPDTFLILNECYFLFF